MLIPGVLTNTSRASRFGKLDYLKVTIFGFGLAALGQSFHLIILPARLLDLVSQSQKNTYLALLSFSGLILAMLVQPIAGMISDHSRFSWGRRRPFILLGTILVILLLSGIGSATSYVAIFAIWCLIQVSTNMAQGPYQALIPDLVPADKHGRASGVKVLLEVLGMMALIYPIGLLVNNYQARQEGAGLWLALALLAVVLLGTMLATVLAVKERPGIGSYRLLSLRTLYQSFKIDVRKNRPFIWFLVSRLLIYMALTTVQQFAYYFLQDVVGVADPSAVTARFTIVVALCMMATAYPTAYLSDRLGRRPVLVASGLIGALGILLILLLHSYGLTVITICGGLIGMAVGAFMSTNWALAVDLVPRGEEAKYLGLTNLATAGGAALARYIGPVIDFFNMRSFGLGYQVMFLACFIYFVAGSLLLLKIKNTRLPQ